MQTLEFDVQGMSCGGCTGKVQRALARVDGVSHADVTLKPGTASVLVDPTRVTAAQLESVITQLGYHVRLHNPGKREHSSL